MKICHITSSHQRYDGRIFEKECSSLAKKYETYLLCADDLKDEVINNVHFVSIGFKPKNRYERFFKVMNKIYAKATELDCDVYHLHDPELLRVAVKLKNKGKKVIFDSHEDYPNCISERSWIPKMLRSTVSKLYAKKEKRILKKIDAVVTVTPMVYDRIKKINNNTVMITNFPIIDKKISKKKVEDNILCFAGGISKQWMHHNIIKAIRDLDITYLLIGDNKSSYFESLTTIDGFNKVNSIGRIKKDKVKEYYAKSSIGIALNDYVANVGFHEGSLGNTKVFEYMEAGLPVVATDFKLWKKIIDDGKCGICVNPNNIEEIKEAIEYLITNKKEAELMGQNGRKLVEEKYNWKIEENKLYDLYKRLI